MYIEENDIRTPRERIGEQDVAKSLLSRHSSDRRTTRNEKAVVSGLFDKKCPCDGYKTIQRSSRDCRGSYAPMGASLAAVYSPIHVWRELYDERTALARGTLFCELDKPLEGRRPR